MRSQAFFFSRSLKGIRDSVARFLCPVYRGADPRLGSAQDRVVLVDPTTMRVVDVIPQH
jgi:hypothetical protein